MSEDEKKEIVIETIRSLMSDLQNKVQKISSTKEKIENEVDACISELMTEKDEICKKFDNAIEESKEKVEELKTLVNGELTAMNETMTVLKDMKGAMENMNADEKECEDIIGKLDTTNGIEENIKAHLSGRREYVYNKYISRQEIRRMVEEKRLAVKLTEHSDDTVRTFRGVNANTAVDVGGNVASACKGVLLIFFIKPFWCQ